MKKNWVALLVGIMVMLGVSCALASGSGALGNGFSWTLDDSGCLTVSGTGEMENRRINPEGKFSITQVRKIVIEGATSIGNS